MRVPTVPPHATSHSAGTTAYSLLPPGRDLVRVGARRWFLQTGLAGFAGLSLADALRARAAGPARGDRQAVILFWLSGGPSQIDTWDPKPDAPAEVRGPYRTIPTSVPGVRVLRAPAAAGEARRQADRHPLGRLLGEQPHADHHAGRQPARPAHQRRQGRRRLPVDGVGGGEVPRAERPGDAGVRRPGRLVEGRRVGRRPHGQRVRAGEGERTARPARPPHRAERPAAPGPRPSCAGSSTACNATSTPATRWS